jgi:hypothetical protein
MVSPRPVVSTAAIDVPWSSCQPSPAGSVSVPPLDVELLPDAAVELFVDPVAPPLPDVAAVLLPDAELAPRGRPPAPVPPLVLAPWLPQAPAPRKTATSTPQPRALSWSVRMKTSYIAVAALPQGRGLLKHSDAA